MGKGRDVRLHLRRFRLLRLQSLPGRLQGQEQPARWRELAAGLRGLWWIVAAKGEAWTTDVFAYNLSIACNHCVHPKCAGVCPTDAFVQREDGIVYIDESKCIGCGYCNWACPYAVPQYNPALGHMTKCNFCMDNLDAGLPPACVAACPLRVLDFVTIDDRPLTVDSQKPLWLLSASEHPFPLPKQSRTEPHLAVKPHVGMLNGLEKEISNWEEIRPRHEKSKVRRLWSPKSPDFGIGELPLAAFTLSVQMAAGMAFFALFSGPLTVPVLITIGGIDWPGWAGVALASGFAKKCLACCDPSPQIVVEPGNIDVRVVRGKLASFSGAARHGQTAVGIVRARTGL